MHKNKLLKELQDASTAIKQKTSKAQSRLSNLENDIISLKKSMNRENQNRLDEMREIVDSLRLDKKSQILKMPNVFKNLKLMAYELIEGIVTRRRLATFKNSGKLDFKGKTSYHFNIGEMKTHPIVCEQCNLNGADYYGFKGKRPKNYSTLTSCR